jgi:hypothetical protein
MKFVLFYPVLILLLSCKSGSSSRSMDMGPAKEMAAITRNERPTDLERDNVKRALSPEEKVNQSTPVQKKIIKDGRMGIHVQELEKTKHRIDTLVDWYHGYYAKEDFSNTNYQSEYTLKIRIPASDYNQFIAGVESGDVEINYKNINARDVTEEFIDLETRLENKRNYLKRYTELLKKANTIKEILDIEEKVRVIEEEIESTEGRLKYLSDLVAFSTLELTLSKDKDFQFSPEQRDKFGKRLKQSVSKGWYGFIDFLLFVIKIWPFWVILAAVWYFWKKIRRKKKKKS